MSFNSPLLLQQKIDVMQEALKGKKIELRRANPITPWMKAYNPQWDWFHYDYRVAKEKKKGCIAVHPKMVIGSHTVVYASEEEARKHCYPDCQFIQIEWEE